MLKRSGFKLKSRKSLKRTPLRRSSIAIIKPQKPTKAKTITKLRKDLWKLFSLFIRQRDGYKCFTCGKVGKGAQIHGGHFITGATCSAELYFDETNVHAQCYHDNINLSGNWVVYEKRMIEKYGKEHTDNLKLRRTLEMGRKMPSEWYESKIIYYQNKLEAL